MTNTWVLVDAANEEISKKEVLQDFDLKWGEKIPVRDGIRLNATLYRPKTSERAPAIFTLTPYIADSYHPARIILPGEVMLFCW